MRRPKKPELPAPFLDGDSLPFLPQTYETVSVKDVHHHPENPNVGARELISESISVNGFYGAIIVQRSTGYVLAGNHRLRELISAGAETVPVIYLDVDDDHARRILLADNGTARAGHYDERKLAELLGLVKESSGNVAGTGFTLADFKQLTSQITEPNTDPNYERKVEAPIYEIHGRCPSVEELTDASRALQLIAEIDAAEGISEDVREFLRAAAHRHRVFDYESIAEFYAHASPEVQRLMENSALVIVDFERAIELGFVRLAGAFSEQYAAEQGGDEDED